jgi:hypothetical protein
LRELQSFLVLSCLVLFVVVDVDDDVDDDDDVDVDDAVSLSSTVL